MDRTKCILLGCLSGDTRWADWIYNWMVLLSVSLVRGFKWILGLERWTGGPIPRLRLDFLSRLLLLRCGNSGKFHAHEDEDEETRKSGCGDVNHGATWVRCAVWDSPTDLRMLSHFASSTSVLRSPNDPIVLLYMVWGVHQDSVNHGSENDLPR